MLYQHKKLICTGIYIFFFVTIFLSCGKDSNNRDSFNIDSELVKKIDSYSSYDIQHISAKESISSESFNLLGDIKKIGSYIFLLDKSSQPPLHIINSNMQYIKGVGTMGRGPGEFLTPTSLHKSPNDTRGNNELCIYDGSLLRFTCFSESQLLNNDLSKPEQIYSINSKFGIPLHLSLLNDSLLISTGVFTSNKRIVYHNLDSGLSEEIAGELPLKSQIPISALQHAYQSHISVKPDQSAYVLATRHADQLEIFRGNGELYKKIIGEKWFSPKFEVEWVNDTPVMVSGGDLRFGYIDIAVTNEMIFALYSGRLREDGNANFGNYILCYDWLGNLKKIFTMDEYLFSIEINEVEGVIYGLEHYPNLSFNTYDITEYKDF